MPLAVLLHAAIGEEMLHTAPCFLLSEDAFCNAFFVHDAAYQLDASCSCKGRLHFYVLARWCANSSTAILTYTAKHSLLEIFDTAEGKEVIQIEKVRRSSKNNNKYSLEVV